MYFSWFGSFDICTALLEIKYQQDQKSQCISIVRSTSQPCCCIWEKKVLFKLKTKKEKKKKRVKGYKSSSNPSLSFKAELEFCIIPEKCI